MEEHIIQTPEGLSLTVPVRIPLGLHARPAARLSSCAQEFSAEITIKTEEAEADAKSMLDILSLAISEGSDVTFCAKGNDAREALLHLASLILEVRN